VEKWLQRHKWNSRFGGKVQTRKQRSACEEGKLSVVSEEEPDSTTKALQYCLG